MQVLNNPIRKAGPHMRRIFKEHPIIPLLILTNLVFFVLYRRFLFKGAVFMYSDVGSDSLSSSYPIIAELSRLFETRTFSHYTIWSGLGQDTTATFLQYINPFKLMLLFFGRDNFPIGIMLYLFLQNNLIAIFSYNTFRLLSGNAQAALLPALGWTFSSYIVVWGQNYSYGCCMLMFTIMMYLLELVLRREYYDALLILDQIIKMEWKFHYFKFFFEEVEDFTRHIVLNNLEGTINDEMALDAWERSLDLGLGKKCDSAVLLKMADAYIRIGDFETARTCRMAAAQVD